MFLLLNLISVATSEATEVNPAADSSLVREGDSGIESAQSARPVTPIPGPAVTHPAQPGLENAPDSVANNTTSSPSSNPSSNPSTSTPTINPSQATTPPSQLHFAHSISNPGLTNSVYSGVHNNTLYPNYVRY